MKKQTILALGLALVLSLGLVTPTAAAQPSLAEAVTGTAAWLVTSVPDPQVGSMGGEWTVLGLARSGAAVPADYWKTYQTNLAATLTTAQGVLHKSKYTEYARVTLALTALGKNPRDVAGYDLLAPLGDWNGVLRQGINGPIWALLALDAGNYAVPTAPVGAVQATRQAYVEEILSRQCADGGWCLGSGQTADPDVTAMALQALAGYRAQGAVQTAVDRGLACLSGLQDAAGGFSSWGNTNVESTAQSVIALCRLGISLEDSRFVKDGHTLLENLLSYRQADGSFRHTTGGQADLMATEQGMLALTGALRAQERKPDLYDMRDLVQTEKIPTAAYFASIRALWQDLPAQVGERLLQAGK